MTLSFPDTSRVYDATCRQIRFVGHDGFRAISFRVNVDAIMENASDDPDDEDTCLRSFDGSRNAVQSVAREVYFNKRSTMYLLTAEDFR